MGGLCSLGDVEGGPTFLLPSDKCPGPWRQKNKQTKDTDLRESSGTRRNGRAGSHGLKNCRLLTRHGHVSKSTERMKVP